MIMLTSLVPFIHLNCDEYLIHVKAKKSQKGRVLYTPDPLAGINLNTFHCSKFLNNNQYTVNSNGLKKNPMQYHL